jgi:hypothetical protein
MLRQLRPSLRYRFKFVGAVAVRSHVMQRQRLPQSAPKMLRPCSAGCWQVLQTASDIFAYVEIASGFSSRRF